MVCPGIGLHTGKKITLTIKPLPPNSGIRFHRNDLVSSPHIPARLENVVDTRLATTIAQDGHNVSTIEHLMSAFAGMGIDNALVELDGPEVPIMDGSAGPYMYLLKNVGVRLQDAAKKFFLIKKPFSLKSDDKNISVIEIIQRMDNFSGAEIKSVATEAGYFAIRNNRYETTKKDFIDGLNKVKKQKEIEGKDYMNMFG